MESGQRRLGKYELLEQLGKGAQAAVYRARDASLDRDVAIKLLPLGDDPRRFEQEARVVAKFDHTNILPIYDFGEEGGQAYFVTQLVRGGSLAQLMGRERLSEARISVLIEQLASALDYAHERGVIHRDVKPANVLLTEDGRALLADFGIAKVLTDSVQRTQMGASPGTPAYMSPDPTLTTQPDGRSDQYSLAIVAYELICGERPFQGMTPAEMLYHHVHTPANFERVEFRDRAALVAVLARALAKQRATRFETCTAFAKALRGALNVGATDATIPVGLGPPAAVLETLPTPLAPLEAAPSRGRRTWVMVALAGALATVAWWFVARRGRDASKEDSENETSPKNLQVASGAKDATGESNAHQPRGPSNEIPWRVDVEPLSPAAPKQDEPAPTTEVNAPTVVAEVEPLAAKNENSVSAEAPAPSTPSAMPSGDTWTPSLNPPLNSAWNLEFRPFAGAWIQTYEVTFALARELGLETRDCANTQLPWEPVNLDLATKLVERLNARRAPAAGYRFSIPTAAEFRRIAEAFRKTYGTGEQAAYESKNSTKTGHAPKTGLERQPGGSSVVTDGSLNTSGSGFFGFVGNVRELATTPDPARVEYFGGADIDRIGSSIDVLTIEKRPSDRTVGGSGLRLFLILETK